MCSCASYVHSGKIGGYKVEVFRIFQPSGQQIRIYDPDRAVQPHHIAASVGGALAQPFGPATIQKRGRSVPLDANYLTSSPSALFSARARLTFARNEDNRSAVNVALFGSSIRTLTGSPSGPMAVRYLGRPGFPISIGPSTSSIFGCVAILPRMGAVPL